MMCHLLVTAEFPVVHGVTVQIYPAHYDDSETGPPSVGMLTHG